MKIYHVSPIKSAYLELSPRVPDNFMTRNGFEDGKTKRVCVSSSIDGALKAMSMNLKGKTLHVYSADFPDYEVYKPTTSEVPDAHITGERWIKKPVTLNYERSIKVGEAKNKEYNYSFGQHSATLYGWNYKKANEYKSEIEKTARKLLDENQVKDVINRHITSIDSPIINRDTSHSKAYRGLSMPWNENIQVETYLRDKDNQSVTNDYLLPNEDGPIVSNLVRKGVPFSNKTRETIIIPNEIRLKDKYKKKGIGTGYFFAIENAGRELGADKLDIVPDEEGTSVWTRGKFGLSMSKSNKKEFDKAARKYYRTNKGMNNPRTLRLSEHDPRFINEFLRNNKMLVSLDKNLKKGE